MANNRVEARHDPTGGGVGGRVIQAEAAFRRRRPNHRRVPVALLATSTITSSSLDVFHLLSSTKSCNIAIVIVYH